MRHKTLRTAMITLGLASSLLFTPAHALDPEANASLLKIVANTSATGPTASNVNTGNNFLQNISNTLGGVATSGSTNNYAGLTIADLIRNILAKVNTLPDSLAILVQMALALTLPDNSEITADIQSQLTLLGNTLIQDTNTQLSLQTQLNVDLLGKDANTKNLPFANDLVYSTILGAPFFNPDPRSGKGQQGQVNAPYNYIKNASGINLRHVAPEYSWRGDVNDVLDYQNYYSSVNAIESFGGYVLSQQYADGNQFNNIQTDLIKKASDPKTWLKEIASEKIGIVLRQILLFQSQSFLMLTQLAQTQRQMAAAQVMTNTILIANNRMNEKYALSRAQGVQPAP